MEANLELTLMSLFNIDEIRWSHDLTIVRVSNWLSGIAIASAGIIPIA